jgi:hypothetical protein
MKDPATVRQFLVISCPNASRDLGVLKTVPSVDQIVTSPPEKVRMRDRFTTTSCLTKMLIWPQPNVTRP